MAPRIKDGTMPRPGMEFVMEERGCPVRVIIASRGPHSVLAKEHGVVRNTCKVISSNILIRLDYLGAA